MFSISDEKHVFPFFPRYFLIYEIGFQLLTLSFSINGKVITASPCSRGKTVFYYIIIKPFRVAFLRDLPRFQEIGSLDETAENLSLSSGQPGLSRNPDLHPLLQVVCTVLAVTDPGLFLRMTPSYVRSAFTPPGRSTDLPVCLSKSASRDIT